MGKIRGAKNFQLITKIKNNLLNEENIKLKVISLEKNISKVPYNKYEMLNFYNNIDYYLCVSYNEGTPNPALEAGSCGVPIISTKVGNIPEIIKKNVNGFFIEPNEIVCYEKNQIIKKSINIRI